MNEYRIRASGAVVTEKELRVSLENIGEPPRTVMLPAIIDASACDVAGVDPVLAAPAPAITSTQVALRNGVVQDGLGNWVYAWTVVNLGQEQVDANKVAAKVAKWEAIKAHRERLSDNGGYKVVVNGVDKWFHSDSKSKNQQIGLVLAGAAANGIPWKTMDGTFVTMSQQLAGQIFQAAMVMEQTIFAVAEQHRVAMEAAADPASYNFSGGWPATYTP